MIRLPWVSRGRFEDEQRRNDELRGQILDLKDELKEARAELVRVNNHWTWRTTGAPIHPELISQEYRIQPAPAEEKKDPLKEEIPSEVEEAVRNVGANPRRVVKAVQSKRNDEAQGLVLTRTRLAEAAAQFESDLQSSGTEKTA